MAGTRGHHPLHDLIATSFLIVGECDAGAPANNAVGTNRAQRANLLKQTLSVQGKGGGWHGVSCQG